MGIGMPTAMATAINKNMRETSVENTKAKDKADCATIEQFYTFSSHLYFIFQI